MSSASAPISVRTSGWRHASAPLVAFVDDDCYAKSDYVSSVLSAFRGGGHGFIGGRVLLYDETDDPITTIIRNNSREFEPFTFIAPGDIHGCNMIFRKEVLAAIGGFDEHFFQGGGDIDVMSRALWRGFSGKFDPRPVVYHHHGRKAQDAIERRKYYDVVRGHYYAKMILNSSSRQLYSRILRAKVKDDFFEFGLQAAPKLARELRGAVAYLIRVCVRAGSARA